jgi:hypothetical protein
MMMTRLEANRLIVDHIKATVEACPDWRFHQILQNIGVEQPAIDQWYEESADTLKNINTSRKI